MSMWRLTASITPARAAMAASGMAALLALTALAPETAASAAPTRGRQYASANSAPHSVSGIACQYQEYAPTESRDHKGQHYVHADAYLKCVVVGAAHLERMKINHVLQRYGRNSQGKGYWYNVTNYQQCPFPGTNDHRFHCGGAVKCTPSTQADYRQKGIGYGYYELNGKTHLQKDPEKGWLYSPEGVLDCSVP
jgi:hypothetical protein